MCDACIYIYNCNTLFLTVNIEDTAPILKKADEPIAKQARVGDADKNKPGNYNRIYSYLF